MILDFLKKHCWLFLVVVLLCSCASDADEAAHEISILNWNLETFFDAHLDGNEYAEFRSAKSNWGKEKYAARLKRLGEVLKTVDADVVVMEELEKKEQLYDIFNVLSGGFDLAKAYKYGAFASASGASIGCAVISRFPLSDVLVHEVYAEGKGKMPSMRPILQVNVRVDGKNLPLFVNHWKSKAGGAEESEFWRDAQEENLSRLMKGALDADGSAIAAGDFNRDISEFCRQESGGANIQLKGAEQLSVYSPWLGTNASDIGSYWYKDHWERIDHFFVCGNVTISAFSPQTGGDWADEEGKPKRYTLYNGAGYSDHLPILCRVQM